MCTLITSKGTDIDENIANQNHATRTPKPGYLNLSNITAIIQDDTFKLHSLVNVMKHCRKT